ncbi:MAG: hypothetical protein P4N60_05025 [Verrucomicrobiae bacterium]|nr:hypothetical protein [Verrucomicrobiae bacterium]
MKPTIILNQNILAAAAGLVLMAAVMDVTAADSLVPTNAPAASQPEPPPVIGVQDFQKHGEAYAGQEIVLQGFVTDYCKRKGCWAILHDLDPDAKGQVRVKQDEEGPTFKPFLPELQGQTILVKGKVQSTKIDTNYLDKWEARIKTAKAEADKAPAKADKDAEKTAAVDNAAAANLKQIAALRERVANSEKGYLTSVSLTVTSWEPKADKP